MIPQSEDSDDAELLSRAATWQPDLRRGDLTVQVLKNLMQTSGIDFATAVAYDRAARYPANAEFVRRVIAQEMDQVRPPDVVGVVPGAFYKEYPNSGAAGRRILALAENLGWRAETIPVHSLGFLDENARSLFDWVQGHAGQRILLVSLSKGGADVKYALGRPEARNIFSHVAGWVNLSGIVQGAHLAAWMKASARRMLAGQLWLLWQGHRMAVMEELRYGRPGSPLAVWPALPPHLAVVHVYGFPLERHLHHKWAPRAYERLRGDGPNDGGGFLLGETCALPGVTFPIWGVDHYLEAPTVPDAVLQKLLCSALALGDELRQASQTAPPPRTAPASKSKA